MERDGFSTWRHLWVTVHDADGITQLVQAQQRHVVLANDTSDLTHALADDTSLKTHRVVFVLSVQFSEWRCRGDAVPDDEDRNILHQPLCLEDGVLDGLEDVLRRMDVHVNETLLDVDAHLPELLDGCRVLGVDVDDDATHGLGDSSSVVSKVSLTDRRRTGDLNDPSF